jgi:hypothetical protein
MKNSKQKNEKKMEKKLTFCTRKLGVGTPTYTWQEGEGKYHTNQRNNINTNAKRIATTITQEKQHQELGK